MEYLRNDYEAWLSHQRTRNGGLFKKTSIRSYSDMMKNTLEKFGFTDISHNDIFFIDDVAELDSIFDRCKSHPDFDEIDKKAQKRAFSNGMRWYRKFLLERKSKNEINYFKPSFWKISHGNKVFSTKERELYAKEKVIVVAANTKPLAQSSISQGGEFMKSMKKGDIFYLCYSNEIKSLCRLTSNEVTPCVEKGNGWYKRPYEVIEESRTSKPYTGDSKWWAPSFNSTCVQIKEEDYSLFEENILIPFFNKNLTKLFQEQVKQADIQYWWLNANPKVWKYSDIGIGEVISYTLYNDNNNKRRIFQNFLDARAGDLVIGYESTPVKKIMAICKISREQDGTAIYFEKVETLPVPIEYETLKSMNELSSMEYFSNPQGSLFRMTSDEYNAIYDAIREANPVTEKDTITSYTKTDFLKEVFIPGEKYDTILSLLKRKKNIILEGPPGVGKTFAAKRLAYSAMGCKDEKRIKFVQFHQSYSYEDFIMGYKPDGNSFSLKYGIFHDFCRMAAAKENADKDFFFIIDEINRGNMSKIFGELLMLIEADKRSQEITLAYDEMPFSVPENVYLIGMMNTADRSLAMIDYALRRRFCFIYMKPAFDSQQFIEYQAGSINMPKFDALIATIGQLNEVIKQDASLGGGFLIGHSYFCTGNSFMNDDLDAWMKEIVEYELIPILREYWFDNDLKFEEWAEKLREVVE